MVEMLLRLEDLFKSYNIGRLNQVDVLRGINLSLSEGETVGLISPSGAGKTTLLNIAGLLDQPTSGLLQIIERKVFEDEKDSQGKTVLSDRDVTNMRRDLIGFVYQFHHLLPEFSAVENVELPKLLKGKSSDIAREEAKQLLYSVGLGERLNHKPNELSGGEQQRVAICRALANNPKILLADEPTGNLDSETSQVVFDILIKLVKKTGMGALIATHNIELASKLDRVIKIDSGQLISYHNAKQIF